MGEKIYISKRCKYCHELLVILHKNKDIINIPVIDIDTSPYPNIIKSVPCMIIDDKYLPGGELFKFIDYIINEKRGTGNKDNGTEQKEGELNGTSINKNDNNNSNGVKEKNTNESEEDINGFCFGGSCALGFSSIDDNIYDTLSYASLEHDDNNMSCNIEGKSEPISTQNDKQIEFNNRLQDLQNARNM